MHELSSRGHVAEECWTHDIFLTKFLDLNIFGLFKATKLHM